MASSALRKLGAFVMIPSIDINEFVTDLLLQKLVILRRLRSAKRSLAKITSSVPSGNTTTNFRGQNVMSDQMVELVLDLEREALEITSLVARIDSILASGVSSKP